MGHLAEAWLISAEFLLGGVMEDHEPRDMTHQTQGSDQLPHNPVKHEPRNGDKFRTSELNQVPLLQAAKISPVGRAVSQQPIICCLGALLTASCSAVMYV